MPGSVKHSLKQRVLATIDAAMAALGGVFVRNWSRLERSYRRPLAWFASRLKFAYFPLLGLSAISWLAWDWTHAQSLNAAENAIFDTVVKSRPFEPAPSGQVVVIDIDECSLEYFRMRGEGGWPWSRQRHADLLDELDRAGVRAVGFDVMFIDPSQTDPDGDRTLEAMAEGGAGRFVFESSRLHSDYDEGSPLRASQAPGAFALGETGNDPKVALLLPYGRAMTRYSAVANVTRDEDGVLRDIPLYETVGDWALPSLPLRLAMTVAPDLPQHGAATVRPNWRESTRLPRISAADLLSEGKPVCRDAGTALPALHGRVALIGFTASGLNDAKPTPVDPVMPGVEVMAEATEALIANSGIGTPPVGMKYAIAALLVLLTTLAFYRGEPAGTIDSAFVAANTLLLGIAFVGLMYFSFFFDIFASVGFGSLVFGLCRMYAGVQRGRAVGNGDYRLEFEPGRDRWLAVARLRFVPDDRGDAGMQARRRRQYRRRLRRFLYSGSNAVMLEGVVERKSWLHASLSDLTLLLWGGESEGAARAAMLHDLDRLEKELPDHGYNLPSVENVRVAFAAAPVDDAADRRERRHLRELVAAVLASRVECPLDKRLDILGPLNVSSGES